MRDGGSGALDHPVTAITFLLRHVRRRPRLTAGVLSTIAAGALCAVAAQYGLKLLVDEMTAQSGSRHAPVLALALFLGLLGAESALWRLGGWLGSRAVIIMGEEIRLDLFEQVTQRSWSFFNAQASGALGSRILAAATSGTAVLRTTIWNVLPPLTDLVGCVFVLLTIDWRIAIGLMLVTGAGTWGLHRLGQAGSPLHLAYHQQAAGVSGDLMDVIANIGLVQAYGAERREQERLRQLIAVESQAHSRSWLLLERLRAGHDAAFWLATGAVLFVAVEEWSGGAISTGSVVVASTLTLRVLMGSRELALSLLGMSQQLGAVSEALTAIHGPNTAELGGRPHKIGGDIELRAVHYAPDCCHLVLRGIDLIIPAGQRVGIVGPSGAGKSTLLRLIQGLVTANSGAVLLDGRPIASVLGDSPADAFSVVTQEVPLLHRSIAENLCYGRPDAAWGKVLEVSRRVGCDAFIRGLPQGYQTVVGERGLRLSGGQRQRVAIARALLRAAPVLLLDEATSALDSQAECEVQRAILALAGERTVLAVAHRLSTVMDFDRIIVVQDGRIVEDGPPDELRRANGPFAEMWRLQQRFSAGSKRPAQAAE